MYVFNLTFPNNNAWNGKFSGRHNVYARCKKDKDVPKGLNGRSFYYNFGDGWGALVSVTKMPNSEARGIMNKSVGFMGYDWMIDSIIKHGEITDKDIKN